MPRGVAVVLQGPSRAGFDPPASCEPGCLRAARQQSVSPSFPHRGGVAQKAEGASIPLGARPQLPVARSHAPSPECEAGSRLEIGPGEPGAPGLESTPHAARVFSAIPQYPRDSSHFHSRAVDALKAAAAPWPSRNSVPVGRRQASGIRPE